MSEVNEQQLRELVQGGEGLTTEFKACRTQLNRDVYETVCAFINRHGGGTVLLGVEDSGVVAGVDPDAVDQIKKDFVVTIDKPPEDRARAHSARRPTADGRTGDGQTHDPGPRPARIARRRPRLPQ